MVITDENKKPIVSALYARSYLTGYMFNLLH